MEKTNRNHITTVFEDIIKSFKAWLLPLLIIIFSKTKSDSSGFVEQYLGVSAFKFGAVVLILLLIFVLSFAKWYRKSYQIRDGFIIVREGVFVSKRREIPVNKIQTVNISQNVPQKIFNTAELKIDTGNSTLKTAEVSIVVRLANAEAVKEAIINHYSRMTGEQENAVQETYNKETGSQETGIETEIQAEAHAPQFVHRASTQKNEEPVTASYSITLKELVITGLTSNSLFAGMAFLLSAYALLDDFADFIGSKINSWFMPYIKTYDISKMTITQIVTFILIIFVIYLVFSSAASVIGSIVKHYGFTVKRQGSKLLIKYGLFNTRSYMIPVKKIKVVHMKQSMLRQILGIEALHVESVGYGNEKGESSTIYPVISIKKGKEVLSKLLPEFNFEQELVKVPRRSLGRFIRSSLIFPTLACIIVSLIFRNYGFISFILLPFIGINGFLEYRNSAAGRNSRLICISSRGYSKTVTLLSVDGIQSVTHKANYFQRRKGIFDLSLSFQSNTFGSAVRVKNLDESLKPDFTDVNL